LSFRFIESAMVSMLALLSLWTVGYFHSQGRYIQLKRLNLTDIPVYGTMNYQMQNSVTVDKFVSIVLHDDI